MTKINVTRKTKVCCGLRRNHCGKRRKCWLPAFSPFPTMFSNALFFTWDCVVRVKPIVRGSILPSLGHEVAPLTAMSYWAIFVNGVAQDQTGQKNVCAKNSIPTN